MDVASSYMRTRTSAVLPAVGLALALLVAAMSPRPIAAQGSACRTADSVSAAVIAHILQYTTATTGGNVTVRDSLKLPRTSQVTLESSPAACQKALVAFATEFASQGSGLSSRVYVIKVGGAPTAS